MSGCSLIKSTDLLPFFLLRQAELLGCHLELSIDLITKHPQSIHMNSLQLNTYWYFFTYHISSFRNTPSLSHHHFISHHGLILLLILWMMPFDIIAQCGIEPGHEDALRSIGCRNWDNYGITDQMSSQTPIKTIQVSLHFFMDDNENGNFDNGNYVKGVINDANRLLANLLPMTTPTNSPYYRDARIRIKVMAAYTYDNTDMWQKSDYNVRRNGQDLYNFVMNQRKVIHKHNSIHLLFPGKSYRGSGNYPIGGQASGFGDKDWSIISNIYHQYQNNSDKNFVFSSTRGIILHELGHNLGLRHPFDDNSEPCNDTPRGYKESGRNIMDYTSNKTAFTRCQISEMHWHILHDRGDLQDVVIENVPGALPNPAISGYSCIPVNGTSYALSNYQWGTEIKWSISPSNRTDKSSFCGFPFNVHPRSTGTATLSATSDWGTYGRRISRKNINVNVDIKGTVSYSGGSKTIQSTNYIPKSPMTANISATGVSSFSWTKTSGSGSYFVSNAGKRNQMNISSNRFLSFIVRSNTSSCPITKNIAFINTGSSFTLFPNPSKEKLSIKAGDTFSVELPKEDLDSSDPKRIEEENDTSSSNLNQLITLHPTIEQIHIYDLSGHLVYSQSVDGNDQGMTLNVGSLKAGYYMIEITNGDPQLPANERKSQFKWIKE